MADFNRDRHLAIDPEQLEEGDHLLRLGRSRRSRPSALRYSHHTSPEEAARLVEDRPASIVDTFDADGRGGRLNLYLVLRRS